MNEAGNINDKKNITAVILVVMLLLLVGVSYLWYSYHSQTAETETFLDEITRQSVLTVDTKMDGEIFALKCFASYIGSREMSIDEIVSLLKLEGGIGNSSIMRFGFIENSGIGYAVSNNKLVNKVDLRGTKQLERYFEDDSLVIDNQIDGVSGEQVNIYTVPIYRNGIQIGVHSGVVKNEDFKKLLAVSYFNGLGYSLIMSGDDEIVVEPNIEDKKTLDYITNGGFLDKFDIKDLNAKSDVIRFDNGERYWMSAAKLKNSDWYMVMVIPYSAVCSKSNNILIMSVVILLLTLAISVLLVSYIFGLKRQSQKLIFDMAFLDELTGIYNKHGFTNELDRILEKYSGGYAIVAFDIDCFKFINELYGFDEGNKILKHCANVLAGNVRDDEICGRLSGDNFIMLIRYDDNPEIKGRLQYIMDKMSSYVFSIDAKTNFDIIVYSGVYKISESNWHKGVDFLIDRTKMSLMRIDKKHENSIGFYNDDIRKKIVFETELENEMHTALKNGEFEVYLQPKNDVKTGRVAGAEALIRWNHSKKGLLPPGMFIHIFERDGFVVSIDNFVLEEVCKLQRRWVNEGYEPFTISVNQSRLHLYRKDYIQSLQAMLDKYEIDPKYIELEITENMILSSSQILSDVIEQLHNVGFTVSMDDFGSGQSSLNILKDVDIDVLKIDRIFFNEVKESPKGKEVISSVIEMANRLNITTVSEGVETVDQLEFLKHVGCDYVQGFLFDKPMPISEFEFKFKEERKRNIDD